MRKGLRILLAMALIVAVALSAACSQEPAEEAAPEPLLAPPVIVDAGVLRVGVDLDYPPYAGTDKGMDAGIDIDIASAIAAEFNLELEAVQVPAAEAATALDSGEVDIVMSVPFTDDAMASVSLAGSYIADGPAFFSAAEATETLTLDDVGTRKLGAQQGSAEYWILAYEFGEDAVTAYPTLREAFDAAAAGDIEVVGGDAVIGAYILRDMEGVRYAGQIEPGTLRGVAVSIENAELETEVRAALDSLAANGVLDTIYAKWVGDLPVIETGAPGIE